MTDLGPSRDELQAAHCWEAEDEVPGRPEMTAFRRRVRLHQARWREAIGHPIGTQPIVPRDGTPTRLVGNRLPFDYARETGANFLTDAAREAARARTDMKEPHQTFDRQRLWADLLWSPSLAFNLFGELAADAETANRAVRTWWPDAPGAVSEVRFAHSPGRLDPAYLSSLRAFDAAFVLDRADGTKGIVAVDVNYHERRKAETPRPENLARYVDVAERSGAFASGAIDSLKRRGELAVMWLEHLLMLSMLQHPSGEWTWGRYVVVYPAGNSDLAELCERYREVLASGSTFTAMTLEAMLGAGAFPVETVSLLRGRYVASG
jgi:hypothetical protein